MRFESIPMFAGHDLIPVVGMQIRCKSCVDHATLNLHISLDSNHMQKRSKKFA